MPNILANYSTRMKRNAAIAVLVLLLSCASLAFFFANILSASYPTSATRSMGVAYQNISAYPLMGIVHCGGTVNGNIGPTSTMTVQQSSSVMSNGDTSEIVFVPSGWWYQFNGSATFVAWSEYQILTGVLNGYATDLGPSGSNTRVLGTTYTNNTGKGLAVLATVSGVGAGTPGDFVSGVSDANTTYKVNAENLGLGRSNYTTQTVKLFVPASKTYSVSISATGTLVSWFEIGFDADFFESAEMGGSILAANATASQNGSGTAWWVQGPIAMSAGNGGTVAYNLTDSAATPTRQEVGQQMTASNTSTLWGVVMPTDYVQFSAVQAGFTFSNTGSARLYGIGGIPFAPVKVTGMVTP